MVKVLDKDELGQLLVVDDPGGLAKAEVAEDLDPLELVVGQLGNVPVEGDLLQDDLLHVAAAKGKGGLGEGDALLLEVTKLFSDSIVGPAEEQQQQQQNLNDHPAPLDFYFISGKLVKH